ncbi:hypothetical protein HBB16_18730 [Pseudonocardia sp. MCCB 268]|nr:hypothetical protein [Pseudonocardia cytotoxica]
MQLDDTRAPNGAVRLACSARSQATCLGEGRRRARCTGVEQLRKAMATADPASACPHGPDAGYRAAARNAAPRPGGPRPVRHRPARHPEGRAAPGLAVSAGRLADAGWTADAYRTLVLCLGRREERSHRTCPGSRG